MIWLEMIGLDMIGLEVIGLEVIGLEMMGLEMIVNLWFYYFLADFFFEYYDFQTNTKKSNFYFIR